MRDRVHGAVMALHAARVRSALIPCSLPEARDALQTLAEREAIGKPVVDVSGDQ